VFAAHGAAPEVATADNDRDLNAEIINLLDDFGNLCSALDVNSEAGGAGQGFTTEL